MKLLLTIDELIVHNQHDEHSVVSLIEPISTDNDEHLDNEQVVQDPAFLTDMECGVSDLRDWQDGEDDDQQVRDSVLKHKGRLQKKKKPVSPVEKKSKRKIEKKLAGELHHSSSLLMFLIIFPRFFSDPSNPAN